jgi:hypothetical protein
MIMRALLNRLFLAAVVAGLLCGDALFAGTQLEKSFQVTAESEVLLELVATVPGTSWAEKGNEAAAAKLYLDGRYHQDMILFGGPRNFTYSVMLGRLAPGTHSLRVEHNPQQSAPKAAVPDFKDAKVTLLEQSHPEFQALSMAPIIYARRNTLGRFSDVPLLSWYEVFREPSRTTIRYSVIFTNEDGGTQTNALMARWGRTTDIELIYEAKLDSQGKLISAIFQGANHKDMVFKGKKEAEHPLYLVATDNDMFSDKGQSGMRFALRPIPFDLSRASREEVMFQNPWTYQLAAEEMQREGKINEADRVGQRMADPRHYLYLQVGARQQSTAMSFAVKLKGDRKWYTSDIGVDYYRVDRSGYFQTTVRLPAGATTDKIERLAVRCDVAGSPRSREEVEKASKAQCELADVKRIFMLDGSYLPGPSLAVPLSQPLKLQFGDMIELYEAR